MSLSLRDGHDGAPRDLPEAKVSPSRQRVAPVTPRSIPLVALGRGPPGAIRAESGRGGLGLRARQSAGQLVARPDLELPEHLVQVPLDGAGAEEEPCADFRVREPLAGEARDMPLLRS